MVERVAVLLDGEFVKKVPSAKVGQVPERQIAGNLGARWKLEKDQAIMKWTGQSTGRG